MGLLSPLFNELTEAGALKKYLYRFPESIPSFQAVSFICSFPFLLFPDCSLRAPSGICLLFRS